MTEIADLIAAEDKLYFDKKANASAFLKGFIYGAVSAIAFGAGFQLFILLLVKTSS